MGNGAVVVETAVEATEERSRGLRWRPVSELRFIGCTSCRMTLDEFRALGDEGKLELFDVAASRAWRVEEGPDPAHEHPLSRLRQFVIQVAQVRGAPIAMGGSSVLHLLDTDRAQVRAMHPDELVFLDPGREDRIGTKYVWGSGQEHPDVVVEVDSTTDIRRNKLLVYADWGFPELWVEVPEAFAPSRRRRPGLTIYRLEEGEYRESEESGAFPGLTAEAAHRVMSERVPSAETSALASRVGRILGRRTGTGPDDDPLLREQRAESWEEGRAEGRDEGRTEARAALIREVLRARGIPVPAAFPTDLSALDRAALEQAPSASVAVAAISAESVADFFRRLR